MFLERRTHYLRSDNILEVAKRLGVPHRSAACQEEDEVVHGLDELSQLMAKNHIKPLPNV